MRIWGLLVLLLLLAVMLGGIPARAPSSQTDTVLVSQTDAVPVYYRDAAIVLMYHHLDEKESSATIMPERFAAHLDMLREKGYQVVELERITAFLAGNTDLPPNAVAITFDDGYASFYNHAFPALAARRMPASVFVITSQVGSENGIPKLTWEQMRQMEAAGFAFYSHTHDSHRYIAVNRQGDRKPALVGQEYLEGQGRQETRMEYGQRVENDLRLSRNNLEQELGQPVSLLAYPYGWGSDEAASLARFAGFDYLFTIKPALITRSSSPQALGRLDAGTPDLDAAGLDQAMQELIRNR